MDQNFRLPKTVKPLRYDLHFKVDLAAWKYEAKERIDIAVAAPTEVIYLHSVGLDIARAALAVGNKTIEAKVREYSDAQVVALEFPQHVRQGKMHLELQFSGVILDRLVGFYRSEKDGLRYASTQFEAADARRAFPCFDEPEFKARYSLVITVPANTIALANAPVDDVRTLEDGRHEYRFRQTPPISSYLVAFAVGPFDSTDETKTESGIPVRVLLPKGLATKGYFARDAHARSLEALEGYTGVSYPYKKIDAIGVPEFEVGAMENPGAIMYRLTSIAADPETSSMPALKGVYYTAAHELTHMWWGDLVTMKWWNDLWLNESFATFIGYKITTKLNPSWEMWRDFVTTLTRAFSLDALLSTHPISFEVKNPHQATERFDMITYWKGAGVVRMIENYLGEDVFRAGVRSYLNRFREANAEADDFWEELAKASGQDVSTLANTWIKEPGHPIVSVTTRQEGSTLHLHLTQERFFTDPQAAATVPKQMWPIPLVIKYGDGTEAKEHRLLMKEQTLDLALEGSWYFLNAGASGFYRFTADEGSEQSLIRVLQDVLEPHERLLLLDNHWALLKAGKINLPKFLALLEGYRDESDRAVLTLLTEYLDWLSTHVITDTARPAFQEFVRSFYWSHFEALGWEPLPDEPVDVRMKRATVLHALGEVARDERIHIGALDRLEKHFASGEPIDPNTASVLVRQAAKRGNHELHERYLSRKRQAASDPEEEIRYLMALTAFEQPELVLKSLELAMSEVRIQDRPTYLSSLLSRRHSRDATWVFVRDNWSEIEAQTDGMILHNLIRALGHLTHEPVVSEVQIFLQTNTNEKSREIIRQVLERLRLERAIIEKLAAHLEKELF